MPQRDVYLNAANAVVCAVGTATADGVVPGLGSALGGGLSLSYLRQRLGLGAPDLQAAIARELRQALETPTVHLPRDAKTLIPEMLETGVSARDIMAAGRDPDAICTAMLAKMTSSRHKGYEIEDAFRRIMAPIFERYLSTADTNDTLRPAFETAVAETMAHIAGQVDVLTHQFRDTVEELGMTKGEIRELARIIASDVEDHDDAMKELRRAVDIVRDMDKRAELPSNFGDRIDAVRAELNRLNKLGEFRQGLQTARDELAAKLEREQAENAELTRLAVDQAILARDPEGVARLLVEQVQREVADPGDWVGALRRIQEEWNVRGRDQGLRFDMLVAIALTEATQPLAKTADERGALWNELGIVQQELGNREKAPDRLKLSIAAYEAALRERNRERVPMDWAMTQNNLGNTLCCLSERLDDIEMLKQAIVAYENALQEWPQHVVPTSWAGVQNNLGNALLALGEREGNKSLLNKAIDAYKAAQLEWRRDTLPSDWAMAQSNLATSLRTLADLEMNYARMGQAIDAYETALEEQKFNHVPMNWASTQEKLALALAMRFDLARETRDLDKSRMLFAMARTVFVKAGAEYDVERIDHNIAILEETAKAMDPEDPQG